MHPLLHKSELLKGTEYPIEWKTLSATVMKRTSGSFNSTKCHYYFERGLSNIKLYSGFFKRLIFPANCLEISQWQYHTLIEMPPSPRIMHFSINYFLKAFYVNNKLMVCFLLILYMGLVGRPSNADSNIVHTVLTLCPFFCMSYILSVISQSVM